jgi:hypothetical protein
MKKNTGSNIFLYTSIIVFLLPILVTIYEWINYKGKMFGEIEILGFIFYAFMVVLVWLISLFFLLFHFYYKKNAGSKVIDTISRPEQLLLGKSYWCKRCAKCVFLFACFSAFLPKEKILEIFGGNLYTHERLLPLFRQILGIEGFKPLDCVGEPEEMILAMHLASERGEYAGEPAMQLFENHFRNYNFEEMKRKVFTK